MVKLAVIGKDVSQSTSPAMHRFIAARTGNQIEYSAVSVPQEHFEERIDGLLCGYDGLNVTIPYKLSVMPHLKHIEGDALAFGAVNTVVTSTLSGYNTDGLGFMLMLKSNGIDVGGKKVLLLGAGGAGRSVAKKLTDAGASVYVFDCSTDNAVVLANQIKGVVALGESLYMSRYDIIINATGIGMHKTVGKSPVTEDIIGCAPVAIDLIYVPEKSRFLQIAECLGHQIINGRAMLFYQAYYAQCIFCGLQPDEQQAKQLFEEYLKEVENS